MTNFLDTLQNQFEDKMLEMEDTLNEYIGITKSVTCDKNEIIHNNFKLPITYLDSSQLYQLSPTVTNDLELVQTQSPATKPIYDYLFRPKHNFAREMIPEWSKQFTNNTAYLEDTKKVIENMPVYRSNMVGSQYQMDTEKIMEIWKEVKHNDDFLSKYSYMEWTALKHMNESSSFLQTVTFINMVSPLLSLTIPFVFILMPFIVLKIQGLPITFDVYFDVLKSIAKNHFIGKALVSMDSISPEKVLYFAVTLGLYCLQIYQNITQCTRFYENMNKINEYVCEMRNYAEYSVLSMDNFLLVNKERATYLPFNQQLLEQRNSLKKLLDECSSVQPFSMSISKLNELGHLLKCFYQLHNNTEYENAIRYSIGFEGYINNLLGVVENIELKHVSFITYDKSASCQFEEQYYPPLIDNSPVTNDCSLDKSIIITGVNASGKTTVLKTTTINIIFSQQVGCGFYKSGAMNPYTHIHSYLNIPDTSGRDSLFQAESRRCKEIIDIIHDFKDENTFRHFCIFDELYSGTNPIEAAKSAFAFLKYLSKYQNVDFILTTHYITICKKLKKSENIKNYKMVVENITTDLGENTIKYTYKMKKGVSKIQGAVKILEQMNYPKEIIDDIKCYSK